MTINPPEIEWLIFDIATLGLEVGPVVRALRPAARSLMTARRLGAFADEAARVAPEAADALVRRAGRRLAIAADDVVETTRVVRPQSRHVDVSRPDLLARYEQLATQKMPAVVADALRRQRSTPTRRRLHELYEQFRRLRSGALDRSLSELERAEAMEILREARDLARVDFATLRTSVWRRLRRDPELRGLADEMVAAGDAQLGGRAGTVRVHTRWDDGREGYQALEIEHRTRLSDNPWRYNDPDNLILTDSPQNQQFLEALRREGGIWPVDDMEEFIVSQGLLDQAGVGVPGAR